MLSHPGALTSCVNAMSCDSPIFYHNSGIMIGDGISGVVRSFSGHESYPQLAVKTFAVSDEPESVQGSTFSTPQEYVIAERLKHSNIVQTYDIVFDGENWHQIMEHIPFRLQELVSSGRLSLERINSIFAQVVEAVAYMHGLGIAHLDLKLSNIMVTEDCIPKLIDFGSSYVFNVNNGQKVSQVQALVGMLLPMDNASFHGNEITHVSCQVNMELSLTRPQRFSVVSRMIQGLPISGHWESCTCA
jgi:serine/threonine protein kinase